jgi:hypothetical protein
MLPHFFFPLFLLKKLQCPIFNYVVVEVTEEKR